MYIVETKNRKIRITTFCEVLPVFVFFLLGSAVRFRSVRLLRPDLLLVETFEGVGDIVLNYKFYCFVLIKKSNFELTLTLNSSGCASA